MFNVRALVGAFLGGLAFLASPAFPASAAAAPSQEQIIALLERLSGREVFSVGQGAFAVLLPTVRDRNPRTMAELGEVTEQVYAEIQAWERAGLVTVARVRLKPDDPQDLYSTRIWVAPTASQREAANEVAFRYHPSHLVVRRGSFQLRKLLESVAGAGKGATYARAHLQADFSPSQYARALSQAGATLRMPLDNTLHVELLLELSGTQQWEVMRADYYALSNAPTSDSRLRRDFARLTSDPPAAQLSPQEAAHLVTQYLARTFGCNQVLGIQHSVQPDEAGRFYIHAATPCNNGSREFKTLSMAARRDPGQTRFEPHGWALAVAVSDRDGNYSAAPAKDWIARATGQPTSAAPSTAAPGTPAGASAHPSASGSTRQRIALFRGAAPGHKTYAPKNRSGQLHPRVGPNPGMLSQYYIGPGQFLFVYKRPDCAATIYEDVEGYADCWADTEEAMRSRGFVFMAVEDHPPAVEARARLEAEDRRFDLAQAAARAAQAQQQAAQLAAQREREARITESMVIRQLTGLPPDLQPAIRSEGAAALMHASCAAGCKDFEIACAPAETGLNRADAANGISEGRIVVLSWLRYGAPTLGGVQGAIIDSSQAARWNETTVQYHYRKRNQQWVRQSSFPVARTDACRRR